MYAYTFGPLTKQLLSRVLTCDSPYSTFRRPRVGLRVVNAAYRSEQAPKLCGKIKLKVKRKINNLSNAIKTKIRQRHKGARNRVATRTQLFSLLQGRNCHKYTGEP